MVRTGRYSDRDSDGDQTYFLWYAYNHGGQKFDKKASVSWWTYTAYPDGSQVAVKVFPFLPHLAPSLQVPGNKSSASPLFLLAICLFWNGIVGVFWWSIVGVPARQKKLVRVGIPVLGRVLFKQVVTGSYGDSHYVRFEYFANGAGHWGPLPAVFAENAASSPLPATFAAVAGAVGSPFSTTTAANSTGSANSAAAQPPAKAVFNVGATQKANWRELLEQAKAQSKKDDLLNKAEASPGALSKQETVNVQEFMAVQPGDWVTVLHHRSKPKGAIVYRFSPYEAF